MKKLSPNTKVAFSSIVTRKDKKDISKTVQDTNSRLKNYCRQENIDSIQNSNIMEEHLGVKELHLNNPNKAGLFEGNFSSGGGGSIFFVLSNLQPLNLVQLQKKL